MLTTTTGLFGAIGLFVLFIGIVIIVVAKSTKKAAPDEAFVVTGMGGSNVVKDGYKFVFPLIHTVTPVSLRVMKLVIKRAQENALVTKDNLFLDLTAEFFVKVQPEISAIQTAAQCLGSKSTDPDSVKTLIEPKLVSALRTVTATKELMELHTNRQDFTDTVQSYLKNDLMENGLVLESVTISDLNHTSKEFCPQDSFFTALGLEKLTRIVEDSRVKKNHIEMESERTIKAKSVQTREEIMQLEEKDALTVAEQGKRVANIKALAEREKQEFALKQAEEVEKSAILKEKAVEDAQISMNIELIEKRKKQEEAEIEKAQSIQILNKEKEIILLKKEQEREAAEIEKKKAIEIILKNKQIALIEKEKEEESAEIEKLQAMEVKEREKEIALVHKEREKEQAEAQKLAMAAERESAAQNVKTVEVVAQAERETQVETINAKKEAEKQKIKEQNQADIESYTRIKAAEAESTSKQKLAAADALASQKEAEAISIISQAKADEKRKLAEAKKQEILAEEMTKVDIEKSRVEVEQKKVDVRKQDMFNEAEAKKRLLQAEATGTLEKAEALKKMTGATFDFEIAKLRVQADKEVRIEMARAMASMAAGIFENSNVNIYGDGATAGNILTGLTNSMRMGTMVEGFFQNLTGGTALDGIEDTFETVGNGIGQIAKGIKTIAGSTNGKPETVTSTATEVMDEEEENIVTIQKPVAPPPKTPPPPHKVVKTTPVLKEKMDKKDGK